MGEDAEHLQKELRALYEAAGRPPLSRLVALGKEQKPQISISDSTISSWLIGPTVPGKSYARYFFVLVAFLQGRAGAGYSPRPSGVWQQLLIRAREDRDSNRGGRTRADPGPSDGPVTLPADPAGFTGRDEELAQILAYLDPAREQTRSAVVVSAVAGMSGVGKTAVALRAAHQAQERGWFSGGILFADLHGYSPGVPAAASAVASQFLRALGLRDKDVPASAQEQLDAWRMMLGRLAVRGKRLLVVLDNAHSAGQVSPLLPASSPHRALITSRQTLSALAAHRVEVDPLDIGNAVALLDKALRMAHPGDDRATTCRTDAEAIADLCGRLPLALRIIAALLCDDPRRPLRDQAEELADEHSRLDVLDYDDVDDHGRPLAVRAAFDLSYHRLTSLQARAFRILACHPGPDISTEAAAVLLDQPARASRRLLADLTRAHLLVSAPGERWSMHDLVRLYATDRGGTCAEEDQRTAALTRLFDYYRTTAGAAATCLETQVEISGASPFENRRQAREWLEAERTNLLAVVDAASALGHTDTVTSLALSLTSFLQERRYFEDWIRLSTAALTAFQEAGDRPGESQMLIFLGTAFREQRRFDEAIRHQSRALDICRDISHRLGETRALNNLSTTLSMIHRFEEASAAADDALTISTEIGDHRGTARALMERGAASRELHRFDEAIRFFTAAATLCGQLRDHRHEGKALNGLGTALLRARRFSEAIDVTMQAAAILKEAGDRHGEAEVVTNLGGALHADGRFNEAVEAHNKAAAIFRETQDLYREAAALTNLGTTLLEIDRFDEAIDAFDRALDIWKQTGDRYNEGGATISLGAGFQRMGQFEHAIEAYNQGLAIFREMGDRHGEGLALNHLGSAYREKDCLAEAAYFHVRSCAILAETADRYEEGKALAGLGVALLKADRFDEAIQPLTRAASIFKETGDNYRESVMTVCLAHIHARRRA